MISILIFWFKKIKSCYSKNIMRLEFTFFSSVYSVTEIYFWVQVVPSGSMLFILENVRQNNVLALRCPSACPSASPHLYLSVHPPIHLFIYVSSKCIISVFTFKVDVEKWCKKGRNCHNHKMWSLSWKRTQSSTPAFLSNLEFSARKWHPDLLALISNCF